MNLLRNKLHILVVILVVAALAGRYLWHLDDNVGYGPDQPIPFSHKLHAGDYKMDCLYCHSAAEKGPHAGIPPMNVCMGCHSVVGLDKENIKNLNKIYNAGKVVEWQRVHRLPDHVYFSHKWHLRAGVQCQTCHGDVAAMPLISQVNKLEMGDCLDCHRRSEYTTAWTDSVAAASGSPAALNYLRYPYLKYLDEKTLTTGLATQIASAAVTEPARPATGVFAGHNAMTQCTTCHQ
ncbi:MAG TPA: cytochrome c3 family protein [Candidatus Glassbacteria bacterium]|nr:cytochrome c3 family protein [Candidatus Glassbacteria bacterium]